MSSSPVNAATAHESLISVVVILVVVYILIEVAGISSTAAEWALLLLAAALFMRGMANNGAMASWVSRYPWIPGSPSSPHTTPLRHTSIV